jgi:hypothetical protein
MTADLMRATLMRFQELAKTDSLTSFEKLKQIDKIAEDMLSRTNLMFEPEVAYKLASVVFIELNEDPNSYNESYNRSKIESWKKNESVLSFFLQLPLMSLMPSLQQLGENIETYLRGRTATERESLRIMFGELSPEANNLAKSYYTRLLTTAQANFENLKR